MQMSLTTWVRVSVFAFPSFGCARHPADRFDSFLLVDSFTRSGGTTASKYGNASPLKRYPRLDLNCSTCSAALRRHQRCRRPVLLCREQRHAGTVAMGR
jgi:hypothetical protein